MSTITQIHKITAIFSIKKVSITVRFPCSLSFNLKNDVNSQVIQGRQLYKLLNGESTVNQQIQMSCEVPFTNGQYQNSKITLTIFMVSTNGKIPAGSITLNSTQNFRNQKKLPLQKCPDRNATVTLIQYFQKVAVLKTIVNNANSSNSLIQDKKHLRASNFFQSKNTSLSNSNYKYSKVSNPVSSNNQSKLLSSREQRSSSKDYQSKYALGQSKFRLITLQGKDRSTSKQIRIPYRQRSKKQFFGKDSRQKSIQGQILKESKVSRSSSQFLYQNKEQQRMSQQVKILKLQKQKSEYIRELTKLKTQMSSSNEKQVWILQDQLNRVKNQNQNLNQQIDKLKDQMKILERKEKDQISNIKDLKEQIQRKRVKFNQIQAMRLKEDQLSMKKDKTIRELQTEAKKLNQKIDQLKSQEQVNLKRMDFKENSYKQQIKKISQKYAQSQTQRQKFHLDLTNLSNQMQNMERKNLITLKQRQKAHLDEKGKLNKKLQQMNIIVKRQNEELEVNKINDEQVFETKLILSQKQAENSQVIDSLKMSLEFALKKSSDYEQKINLFQTELNQTKNQLSEEKQKLKKKIIETSAQIKKLKQQLQKSETQCSELNKKVQQLQKFVSAKNSQKLFFDSKWGQLKRQHDELKKQQNQRERLAQTLSVQNYSNNQKIGQLKDRLQRQKFKYQQLQNEFQNQMNYLSQSKEYLQIQVKQIREYLQKQQVRTNSYEDKIRKQNDSILDLNQQILSLLQNERRFQEQAKDLSYTNSAYLTQLQSSNSKMKMLKQELKVKNEQNYTMNKKIKEIQQDKCLLEERVYSQSSNLKQSENTLSQKLTRTQNRLQQVQDTLQHLNLQTGQLTEESLNVKRQNHQLKIEIQYKRGQIIEKNAKIQNLQKFIQSLQQREHEKQTQLLTTLQKNKLYEEQTVRFYQQFDSIKLQYETYKVQTQSALSQLFNYISNNQQVNINVPFTNLSPKKKKQVEFGLKAFPSPKLSELQIECLVKRNQIIIEYKSRIEEVQNKIQIQNRQIQKLQFQECQKQQQFQQELFLQKQKSNSLLSEKQQQVNQLVRQVHLLETQLVEANGQIQHLNQTISQLQEVSQEIGDQLRNCEKQKNNLQADKAHLEQQSRRIKQLQIKTKANYEQKLLQLTDETINTISILKKSKLQTQKKLVQFQKSNTLKEETIKSLQIRIVEHAQTIKRYQIHIQDNEKKISSNNMNQTEKVKEISQTLKELRAVQVKLQDLQHVLQVQRMKYEQVCNQNKKLKSQIQNFDVCNKQLQVQIQSLLQLQNQTKNHLSQKQNQLTVILSTSVKIQKDLNQKVQKFDSELQLKVFLIKQLQSKQKQVLSLIGTKSTEIQSKSEQLKDLKFRLNQLQNQSIQLQQQNSHLKNQMKFYQQNSLRIKKENSQMETELHQLKIQKQLSQMREKEIIQLREEITAKETHYQKTYNDLRNSITQSKKELANRTTKQEEQRKKIRDLQKVIQDKNFDLVAQKNRWLGDFERQKRQLNQKTNDLQRKIQTLQQQFQFEKEQLQAEVNQNIQQCSHLSQSIKQRESAIGNYERQIQEDETRIAHLENKLTQSLSQWEREKATYHPTENKVKELSKQLSRFDRFAKEIDSRSKQLIQIAKKKTHQENPQGISQILRQIALLTMKTKAKVISKCSNQKDKEAVINDYKLLQQRLQSAMKSNGVIKPMGFH